jgi:hypothetical protein
MTVHGRQPPDQVASRDRGKAEGCQKLRCFERPHAFSHKTTGVFGVGIVHARQTRVNFVTLEKIVDIVLCVRYSSRGRTLVVQQCRWRMPPQAGRRHRRS